MRPDLRADMDHRKEVVNFLIRNPLPRQSADRFVDAVTERFYSIVFNAYMICVEEGLSSTADPRFLQILDKVESLYPTWEEIRQKVLDGEDIRLPSGYIF